MKFSLIAAVVVLALAQGSFAQDVTDLDRLGQFFEEMKNRVTQELTQIVSNPDFANHAQNIQTQLEPIATKMKEQLKSVGANIEEQIKPMASGMQAQIQPMFEQFQKQVEAIFQTMTDQARAIGN
ncbi:type-4 ice-structuring protein LS-12-like [Chaetodon trifascialis]|uniref:type-4 ice-structuring protein LS-12-like n=1 Tax=Chaetodon trifascialis TaxID=109706 RepID=UPI003993D36D